MNKLNTILPFSVLSLSGISPITLAHEDMEIIVVEGRSVDLLGKTLSASEGVVGQEEIDNRPLLRTGEFLEMIPGMVVTQHSGTGKANQYFLRGFNLDHGTDFNTNIDGMPINMRSHGHGQGYTDLNFIIPETIKTIEYKKGAYYAEVGDFSGAGSAKVSTATEVAKGTAKLALGEDNYQRGVAVDSIQTASGNWLYGIELNQYDGPWTDIKEDLNKSNVLLKHKNDFDSGTFELGVMLYDNSWNSADQIPARAVEQAVISKLGSLDTTVGGESSRNSINTKWETEFFTASAYYIDYDLNLWSNFTYFLNDNDTTDQFEQVDDRVVYGADFNYKIFGHLSNFHTENKLGIQLRIDDIKEVGLYQTSARERLGAVRSDKIIEQSIGAYYENETQYNHWLRSTLGFRYDYFDFDVTPLLITNINDVNLSGNQGSTDDGIISVKGSFIASLSDDWESYTSFGQGFHSNDARGTITRVDPESGDTIDPVDPLVRSRGFEIGLRGFIKEKLNTSFALWSLDLDGELLFVGDAGNTEASRASERKGFEATVYYTINNIWDIDLEYAWTDAKFSDNAPEGNHIPGAINQVLQTGISAEFENGWSSQLRIRYFGERPLIEDNSVKSDSSTLVNFQLGYEKSDWGIKAEVLNLLDSDDHDIDYYYESRLLDEAESVEDIHYHILEPRTVRLSFVLNY